MKVKPERRKWLYGIIAVLMVCAFGIWCFIRENNKNKVVLSESDIHLQEANESDGQSDIYVHITGAIKNPGVIKLPSGSRMIDAIEQLGGMTENADSDSINLAAILKDEDKIHIYTKDQRSEGEEEETLKDSGKVSINKATKEELKTLPGIGDVLAENIIAYRQKNGNFKSLESLKNVDRVGDKVYEKLKDVIML